VGSRSDRPDYDFSEDLILKIFALEDGQRARAEIPNLAGEIETMVDVQREGNLIQIQRQGLTKTWRILLVNIHSIETDHSFERTDEGTLLSLDGSIQSLDIRVLPE
jgi:alpha-D-xyloside xylohydrolase